MCLFSPRNLREAYEHIGEVSDDVSLSPAIPDEIYAAIAAYNEIFYRLGLK
jgi:hypothetical protein